MNGNLRLEDVENDLEAATARENEVLTELTTAELRTDEARDELKQIEGCYPDLLCPNQMPAYLKARLKWRKLESSMLKFNLRLLERREYEMDYQEDSWERDPDWEDEVDQYEDGRPPVSRSKVLKDRWNKLCGKKQEVADALQKEESHEAKTQLTQKMEKLDAMIVKVGEKRRKEKERLEEERRKKEAEHEKGQEESTASEAKKKKIDGDNVGDACNESGRDESEINSVGKDSSESMSSGSGADEDSAYEFSDSETEYDEHGLERKTWYARKKDDGLKYRLTPSEAKKQWEDLTEKAAAFYEEMQDAMKERDVLREEMRSATDEVKRLTLIKNRLQMNGH